MLFNRGGESVFNSSNTFDSFLMLNGDDEPKRFAD
jgi:hypothetical protein